MKAAREVTGVFYADLLLEEAGVSIPGCGMTSNDEVTKVVDIDRCGEGRGVG